MQYVGFIWPRNEQHVLASGDVLFHATSRKSSSAAARDARRIYNALAHTDAGSSAYVAGVEAGRITQLYEIDLVDSSGPRWVDGQYVRHRVPATHADAYRAAGAVVTLDVDGRHATADFVVANAADAASLIDALESETQRTANPGTLVSEKVLEIVDKIRGKKSRYEAAQGLRAELGKIPPPQEELDARKARADAAKAARLESERIALEYSAQGGASAAQDLVDTLEARRASQPLTVAEQSRLTAAKRAVKKLSDAERLVGPCAPVKPIKATSHAWFDGSKVGVILGKSTGVYVPSATGAPTEIPARYALIPTKSLGTSHDPWTFSARPKYDQSLQERDYATSQAEQMKVVFGSQIFEPKFVLNSTPSAIDGPPVIANDGHVLGGNGRGMMLRRSARENSHYENELRLQLEAHAGVFGLSAQQASEHVLVRMLTGSYDRKDISSRLNAAFTQGIDDHAGAVSLGTRLPKELLEIIADGLGDSTLSETIAGESAAIVGHLRAAKIILPSNTSDWLDQTGGRISDKLSARGRERLRAALLGAAVDDKTLLAQMESSTLRDVIERVAPVLLAIEQFDVTHRRTYSMLAPMRLALTKLVDTIFLTDGEFIENFANYSLLDGDDDVIDSPEAVAWLLWLRKHARGSRVEAQKKAMAAFRALPSNIRGGEPGLFGDEGAPGRAEWFRMWSLDAPDDIQRVGGRAWIAGEREPTSANFFLDAPEKEAAPEPTAAHSSITVEPAEVQSFVHKRYAWGTLFIPPNRDDILFNFESLQVKSHAEPLLLDEGYTHEPPGRFRLRQRTPARVAEAIRLAENFVSPNSYELRQAERRQRLLERAEKKRVESNQRVDMARAIGARFEFGQPILVGHHSERRARRDADRIHENMRKAVAADKYATQLEQRAESVGAGGISSDDPDAIIKLSAQLRAAEAAQDFMKRANTAIKKYKTHEKRLTALLEIGLNEQQAQAALTTDWSGKVGFASYQLANNSANIRRLRKRIEELRAKESRRDVETTHTWGAYRESTTENRVMFEFADKPSDEIRAILRKHAFKWSPSRSSWVRQMTNNAIFDGRHVVKQLDEMTTRTANPARASSLERLRAAAGDLRTRSARTARSAS